MGNSLLIFKLILICHACCSVSAHMICPFYLHLSICVATAYPYHAAEQGLEVLFFSFHFPLLVPFCCDTFPVIYMHINVAIKPLSPVVCPFPTWPRHLSLSPLLLFSLFVWNLLSSWNISSNPIGKSKGITLLII